LQEKKNEVMEIVRLSELKSVVMFVCGAVSRDIELDKEKCC